MKAIIIGAGRGSRLEHETDALPKTLVPVLGRPMLDGILEALQSAGIPRKDTVFVCGYAEEVLRERYPELTFIRNEGWADNNILLSLLTARDAMLEGCITTYADILYEPAVVERLLASPASVTVGCDTAWRARYVDRHRHPETDAEKLQAEGRRVTRISRRVPSDAAAGEFIGVMRLDRDGAQRFVDAFDTVRQRFPSGVFREGRSLQKAYLIDLLDWMLENGQAIERVDTRGGYMEIDTLEDLGLASRWYGRWP